MQPDAAECALVASACAGLVLGVAGVLVSNAGVAVTGLLVVSLSLCGLLVKQSRRGD